jgi:hypothetical protein
MDKVIVLMMSIVMPQGVPDVEHASRMDSTEECWKEAKEFTERGLTDGMKAHGAIGLAAGCMYVSKSKDQMDHEKQEEEKEKM